MNTEQELVMPVEALEKYWDAKIKEAEKRLRLYVNPIREEDLKIVDREIRVLEELKLTVRKQYGTLITAENLASIIFNAKDQAAYNYNLFKNKEEKDI